MAIVLAESVAITKSRLTKGFNGDNLNLNGKVISIQEADEGFKAAGRVKPPYVAVLASGNQKGFASGAAVAFNDYVKDINLNKYNAEAVIGKYFDDMQSVVEKCNIEGGRLSIGIICVYDDCVIAAKTGETHLLRFSEGELFEIALSDDADGRGYQFIDIVSEGDMFALIGEEASVNLDYDGIVNAFDSDTDLKTKIKDFYKLLSVSAKGKDCSVILIKLQCDSERTYASKPLVVANDNTDDDVPVSPEKFSAEPPVNMNELRKADDSVSDEFIPATGKKNVWSKKKIIQFIPIAVLVIILAVTAALFAATRAPKPTGPSDESGSDVTTTLPSSLDSIFDNADNGEDETYTGDFNGSNGMQNVEDTENGGNVDAPPVNNNDDTTRAPETTESESTTDEEETTGSEGSSEEVTGGTSEETTEGESTTSAESETNAEETTTEAEAEITTQEPEPAAEPVAEPISE